MNSSVSGEVTGVIRGCGGKDLRQVCRRKSIPNRCGEQLQLGGWGSSLREHPLLTTRTSQEESSLSARPLGGAAGRSRRRAIIRGGWTPTNKCSYGGQERHAQNSLPGHLCGLDERANRAVTVVGSVAARFPPAGHFHLTHEGGAEAKCGSLDFTTVVLGICAPSRPKGSPMMIVHIL